MICSEGSVQPHCGRGGDGRGGGEIMLLVWMRMGRGG